MMEFLRDETFVCKQKGRGESQREAEVKDWGEKEEKWGVREQQLNSKCEHKMPWKISCLIIYSFQWR